MVNPSSSKAGLTDSAGGQPLQDKRNFNTSEHPMSNQTQVSGISVIRPRSQSLSEDKINSKDSEWETVTQKKRQRNSPDDTNRNSKQTKINDYCLAAIPTSNRFENLNDGNNVNTELETQDKIPKPPSIFIDGVSNIKSLAQMLNDTVKTDYELKILRNEQVKIQLKLRIRIQL